MALDEKAAGRPTDEADGGRARSPTCHSLRVARVTPLTDEAVAIDFEVPADLRDAYRFVPGQHLTIVRGDGEAEARRSYSICAAVGSGEMRIAVKRVPDGELSTYLTTELRDGDLLSVMTPTGRFGPELRPDEGKHYGLIAAGSGITPIISIVASVLALEAKSLLTLVYGNRTRASTMFLDELSELQAHHRDRLTIHHMRSREPIADPVCRGRIDAARLDALLRRSIPVASVDEWYLCGPHGMIEDARTALLGHGVPSDRVHAELFHAVAATAPPDETHMTTARVQSTVTVTLGGRSASFPLASDGEAILQAALPLVPDVPYACRDGVCATCRAKLVVGEVSMERCSALEEDELHDGYVLACQAHPMTEQVELLFDV